MNDADTPVSASRAQARQAVEQFVGHFDPSYRLLAYHAALPLVLTPELLNYLRISFLRNQVPWIAEADLLLSNLCKQVGYELYAMETEVRAYLLDEMRTVLGSERMQAVAQLLIHYVRHLSRTNPTIARHELQAQQWAAMVYLDDQRPTAVREIARSFQALQPQSDTNLPGMNQLIDHSEFARLSEITQTLAQQLEAYPELVRYARQVSILLRDEDRAQPGVALDDIDRAVEVADVALPPLRLLVPEGTSVAERSSTKPDQNYQYDVFISYSNADQDWVTAWLLPQLEIAGVKVYNESSKLVLYESASPGEGPWNLSLVDAAMRASRYVLVVLTPAYLVDALTTFELGLSQARDLVNNSSRTFVLLRQSCQPSLHLATLPYADFKDSQSWERSLESVLDAVRSLQPFTEAWPTLEQLVEAEEPLDYQYDVLVSYSDSGPESGWVREWLVPQLEVAGLRIAVQGDVEELGITRIINFERMITSSRYVIAVFTPGYVADASSRGLLRFAQAYEHITSSWRIVPLLLQPCVLPPSVAARTLADMTQPQTQNVELQHVLTRIKSFPKPPPLSEPDLLAYIYDAFISYSHKDQDWVKNSLLPQLEAAGLRICIPERDFELGLASIINMERAITSSRYTLLVLSPDWVASEGSVLESSITSSSITNYRPPSIPLLLRPCNVPARLSMLTRVDLTEPETRDEQLQRLVHTLRGPRQVIQVAEESAETLNEARNAVLQQELTDFPAQYEEPQTISLQAVS